MSHTEGNPTERSGTASGAAGGLHRDAPVRSFTATVTSFYNGTICTGDLMRAEASRRVEIERVEKQRRDAERYRWLREQIKTPETMVLAQAMFWNNGSRRELDAAIDAALSAATAAPGA